MQTFNKYYSIIILMFLITLISFDAKAQRSYGDTLQAFQKNYVDSHAVVKGADKAFLSFYQVDINYLVNAKFKKLTDKTGFNMLTSEGKTSKYFVYGLLTFTIHDSTQQLYVYQSEMLMKNADYFDYLFVPFGDASSGFESYGGGRYLDFRMNDIKADKLLIDFNKAYNPYCAYTTGYNCPLPPKENLLVVQIAAGEKNYGKPVH
jgi:hypothetical protein